MSLDPLSPDTRDASLPQALVQRLRDLDEELPEALRAQCLAAGASIVPDLIVLLEDEVLADEESEYGWAPLNAAELLGTLGDVRAIPVLLRCLEACDVLELFHRKLVEALCAMGHLATCSCLEAYTTRPDEDLRNSLAEVLCHTETRDERILGVLLDTLERSPEFGAMYLAEYGDARALAALSQVFDALPLSENESMFSNHVFVEVQGAIEELGGELTASQSAKAERADAPRRRFAAQMDEAAHRLAAQQRLAQASSTPSAPQSPVTGKPRKIGRNERCWCGSGKKYKKCHLDLDRP
jgi:HEAT repeat protein